MNRIEQLCRELPGRTAGGHLVLTVSLDLGPGTDGIPSARQVLKEMLREAEAGHSLEHDVRRAVEADEAAVEAAMERGLAAGARGLFYAGSAAGDLRVEVETAQPFRNSAALALTPALFELVRFDMLTRRPVSVVATDLTAMHAMRVHYGVVEATAVVQHDESELGSAHGRTNVEGRVASAGEGAAGGHSRSRIEKQILAHRTQFAADEAARLQEFVGRDDILLIAGADEPRADLMKRLPPGLAERAVQTPDIHPQLTDAEIADMAMALAADAQQAMADREAERWLAGDFRDQAVSGIGAAREAAERGQLGTLLVHEAAITHFGVARDARKHASTLDGAAIEDLLAAALTHGAGVLVARADAMLDRYEGVLGITRW